MIDILTENVGEKLRMEHRQEYYTALMWATKIKGLVIYSSENRNIGFKSNLKYLNRVSCTSIMF